MAPMKGDDRHALVNAGLDLGLVHENANKVHVERAVRRASDGLDKTAHHLRGQRTGGKRPDSARLADGNGEAWRGTNKRHRCQRDRVLNSILPREPCLNPVVHMALLRRMSLIVPANDRVDRARAQIERIDETGRYHGMPAVRTPVEHWVRRTLPPRVAIRAAASIL